MDLTAQMEPFDSFWEAPEDIEKGYRTFGQFYRVNYLPHVPRDRATKTLVVSCGPGYFVDLLRREGYTDVLGIDSDAAKVALARAKGLNCRAERAFPALRAAPGTYGLIVCEQELNHLTKEEMIEFLRLCHASLKPGGTLIVHGLNGANPITGSEARAQNFDHYSTFTEYSLRQVLEYTDFHRIRVFPLDPYVFYGNPFNYVAMAVAGALTICFRACFILYGKANRIFTKKIGAVCTTQEGVTG
ncbi:MAG: class I SAM-dependent methyltransferase [Hyphomicrobiales bacterium]